MRSGFTSRFPMHDAQQQTAEVPARDAVPLRIGILGASAFALRSMAPAMAPASGCRLVAIASRSPEKAAAAAARFGCAAVGSYEALLERGDLDAVYVPLPPGLHEEWVVRALRRGRHVLCEKAFAVDPASAARMVGEARAAGRLVVENILFPHHRLLARVRALLEAGAIGTLRCFRSAFTIGALDDGNVRLRPELGGGARYDLGTYMIKSARTFLGEDLRLAGAAALPRRGRGVDAGACFQVASPEGVVAQLAYGFDCQYQNTWEFIGERGRITVSRVYTPPPDFSHVLRIESGTDVREEALEPDHQARNMLRAFSAGASAAGGHEAAYAELLRQAEGLERLRRAVDESAG